MKSTEPKRFKAKKTYYFEFAILLLFIIIGVVTITLISLTPEQKYVDLIMNRELIGGAHQKTTILIEKFIVRYYGKTGMQVTLAIITLLIINELSNAISAYRRLLFREKLIREGLRAPDDYVDDYVRVSLWKKIINLFAKKKKNEYPSEREMRDSLKKNKYYKEK